MWFHVAENDDTANKGNENVETPWKGEACPQGTAAEPHTVVSVIQELPA